MTATSLTTRRTHKSSRNGIAGQKRALWLAAANGAFNEHQGISPPKCAKSAKQTTSKNLFPKDDGWIDKAEPPIDPSSALAICGEGFNACGEDTPSSSDPKGRVVKSTSARLDGIVKDIENDPERMMALVAIQKLLKKRVRQGREAGDESELAKMPLVVEVAHDTRAPASNAVDQRTAVAALAVDDIDHAFAGLAVEGKSQAQRAGVILNAKHRLDEEPFGNGAGDEPDDEDTSTHVEEVFTSSPAMANPSFGPYTEQHHAAATVIQTRLRLLKAADRFPLSATECPGISQRTIPDSWMGEQEMSKLLGIGASRSRAKKVVVHQNRCGKVRPV